MANEYSQGTLTITKEASGLEGEDVVPAGTTFTVKNSDGTYETFTYADMELVDGVMSYVLESVPLDTTYSVEEADAEVTGYKLDTTIGDPVALSSTVLSGTIAVANEYSQGTLMITKEAKIGRAACRERV